MTELTGMQESLAFKVTRREAEMITPARPTPYEMLDLSDLDVRDKQYSQQTPVIQFYNRRTYSDQGAHHDPAKVIKEAVRKALVAYYPFAGRVRELARPGKKLVVECTGEGILFVEADADVTLEEFGKPLYPPFPGIAELLHNPPGSSAGILDSPLLLIQVTRFKCGGFAFAMRFNHLMADAQGLVQFMTAVAEMARGARTLSVQPVWLRHLLDARDPPRVTCVHPEYDATPDDTTRANIVSIKDMVSKCFFFGAEEIDTLGRFIPGNLKSSSKFEIITAYLWRLRTKSLNLNPNVEVRLRFIINVRSKVEPPLPHGYYGNALASAVAVSTAGELCDNSIGYAIELLKKAKAKVTSEHINSMVDLLVSRDMTWCEVGRTFVVSHISRAGFQTIDFGWGLPAYGGIARDNIGPIPGLGCYYISRPSLKGHCSGTMVPLCLPRPAMDMFVNEFKRLLISPRLRRKSGGSRQAGLGFNRVGMLLGRAVIGSCRIGFYRGRLLSGFLGPLLG